MKLLNFAVTALLLKTIKICFQFFDRHEVHVDSLDEVGHTSLAVACLSNSSEMMAVLLKYGCRIREELLVCIDQDFREGAVTLLDRLYNLQGSICVNQPVRHIF